MAKKIIVFDSGIGGFSILNEILKQKLPVEVVYLADQKFFPYGTKSEVWLENRLEEIARWAAYVGSDAFVIACNTGTVAGITAMRKILKCPIVGVEPVIKPLSMYDKALVLATQAATESKRTQELIKEHGGHIQVYAPVDLATAIETEDNVKLEKALACIKEIVHHENIQAIGLSCTHYPLIRERLEKEFPGVSLYDPAPAVVAQLKKIVSVTEGVNSPPVTFLTTGEMIRFNSQITDYYGTNIRGEKIDI
jgi:glutamate racemase